ncbi:MAG: ATP-binding protein [Spirochaetales bacterium]|nr:ATP-binding protein [Spirochaetales bacterium]
MITRALGDYIQTLGKLYPVLTVTGPRQSGKTTLCKYCFKDLPYLNLENPENRNYALEDPRGFLGEIPDGAVLDEIQRTPDLPSYIQSIVDDERFRGIFVLTGSHNFSVRNTINQSLAGRTAVLALLPFSIKELDRTNITMEPEMHVYTGQYPRIHDKNIEPSRFYSDYVSTYLERDIRSISLVRDLTAFNTFLQLCAGRTGQLLNINSLADDAGIGFATAKEWLSLLEASYILYRLPPFFRNIGKRLIKSPKLYFYDCGLAAFLIGISDISQVKNHPLKGALFETLVVSEFLKFQYNRGRRNDLLFYRDSNNNEVDLLIPDGADHVAVEIKAGKTLSSDYFKGLRNIRKILPDCKKTILVYSGNEKRRQFGTEAVTIHSIAEVLETMIS